MKYTTDAHERPLAIKGLTSYRYRGVWGWVMIGARDVRQALSEASRTDPRYTDMSKLQVWDGQKYVAAEG